MNIRWLTKPDASALYAARTLVETGKLTDPKVASRIGAWAEQMRAAVADIPLPPSLVWEQLIGASGETCVSQPHLDRTARLTGYAALSDRDLFRELTKTSLTLVLHYVQGAGKVPQELWLRSGPLRQHFEARGPGLLHALVRQLGRARDPEYVDVILVLPARGGGGFALPWTDVVVLEAMLANPLDDLPEVVRFCWLLAQLNFPVPEGREGPAEVTERARLASVALIPPVLEAAEYVELARYHEAAIARALEAWHVAPASPATLAGQLAAWWKECRESSLDWQQAWNTLVRRGIRMD